MEENLHHYHFVKTVSVLEPITISSLLEKLESPLWGKYGVCRLMNVFSVWKIERIRRH